PGMIGLETALALSLTELGGAGGIPIREILGLLSWIPARIAGLSPDQGGPVVAGAVANLCIFDPNDSWTVEPAAMASRSRNTPYAGRKVTGRVRHTIYRGEPVVCDGQAQR
ncbi:MAG: dihydroorotase, partial [Acidimicrobiales bacterium]